MHRWPFPQHVKFCETCTRKIVISVTCWVHIISDVIVWCCENVGNAANTVFETRSIVNLMCACSDDMADFIVEALVKVFCSEVVFLSSKLITIFNTVAFMFTFILEATAASGAVIPWIVALCEVVERKRQEETFQPWADVSASFWCTLLSCCSTIHVCFLGFERQTFGSSIFHFIWLHVSLQLRGYNFTPKYEVFL